MKRSLVSGVAFFTLNITLLAGFSVLAFNQNLGSLYVGNDGPMLVSMIEGQFRFYGISTDLHTNFLQGIGDISFPVNVSILPGFWFFLSAFSSRLLSPIILSCVWFAILMFTTVIIVGANYRFPKWICYVAAWSMTIIMFPYFSTIHFYPITSSAPLFIIYPFTAAIMDLGISNLGRSGWRRGFLCAFTILAGLLVILITSPAALIIILPFICLSALVSLAYANSKQRTRMLLTYLVILIVTGACGWIEYVFGLLLNTSSMFFHVPRDLMITYLSSVTFFSVAYFYQIGRIIFIFSLVGAMLFIWQKRFNQSKDSSKRKRAAVLLILGQATLVISGELLLRFTKGWNGPSLLYYEMTLYSLYMLFALYLVSEFYRKFAKYVWPFFSSLPNSFVRVTQRLGSLLLLPRRFISPVATLFIAVAISVFYLFLIPAQNSRAPHYYSLLPTSTSITEILRNEIGVLPGSIFSGRVVSLLPNVGMIPQIGYFGTLDGLSGNDHQSSGLWLKDIPTLHQYSPLISPKLFSLFRKFLTVPNDVQNRSWTNFSRIDLKILKLLGVRFILSTKGIIEGTKKRTSLYVPKVDALHLFEIANANIRGISTKNIAMMANLNQGLEFMGRDDFDLQTAIILKSSLAASSASEIAFSPATESKIGIEKGFYRVHAKSGGRTLLIIPIEFSHCIDVTVLSGERPEVLPVDIALTGILFNRNVDITLVQQIGPFTHPRCRMQDYLDFSRNFDNKSPLI